MIKIYFKYFIYQLDKNDDNVYHTFSPFLHASESFILSTVTSELRLAYNHWMILHAFENTN